MKQKKEEEEKEEEEDRGDERKASITADRAATPSQPWALPQWVPATPVSPRAGI